MAIPSSGTFEYRAVATDDSFIADGRVHLEGDAFLREEEVSLVGPSPEIRLNGELFVIFSESCRLASMKQVRYVIGDWVHRCLKPADVLYASRTSCGDSAFRFCAARSSCSPWGQYLRCGWARRYRLTAFRVSN